MRPSTPAAISRPDLLTVERSPRRLVRWPAVAAGMVECVVVAAIMATVLIPPGLVVLVLTRLWRSL